MIKNITSYCSTKDKIVSISVRYIQSSALEDSGTRYVKNTMASCSHDKCKNCSACSLYDSLPYEIRK